MFSVANWKTKYAAMKSGKHSLHSFFSNFFMNVILICYSFFPSIWNIPRFQRINYLSLCCDARFHQTSVSVNENNSPA
jgi:hypothetical protein